MSRAQRLFCTRNQTFITISTAAMHAPPSITASAGCIHRGRVGINAGLFLARSLALSLSLSFAGSFARSFFLSRSPSRSRSRSLASFSLSVDGTKWTTSSGLLAPPLKPTARLCGNRRRVSPQPRGSRGTPCTVQPFCDWGVGAPYTPNPTP